MRSYVCPNEECRGRDNTHIKDSELGTDITSDKTIRFHCPRCGRTIFFQTEDVIASNQSKIISKNVVLG